MEPVHGALCAFSEHPMCHIRVPKRQEHLQLSPLSKCRFWSPWQTSWVDTN